MGRTTARCTATRVGILIFGGVEVLDFCGPFEVFSVTRLDEARRREDASPFEVVLVAERPEPVSAVGGLRVLPDHTLDGCPPLDILIVPGGWGTRREVDNPRLLEWITARSSTVEKLASVCTGALLLGRAGLLDRRRATTHWASLGALREAVPAAIVIEDQHVVEDGDLLTSAGISAGIDLALHLVASYCGEPVARATARRMEYPYPDDNRRRS